MPDNRSTTAAVDLIQPQFIEELTASGGPSEIETIDASGRTIRCFKNAGNTISSGVNLFCAEVERAFSQDPTVFETCVFGIPEARLGEKIVAAVTLHAGGRADDGRPDRCAQAALRGQQGSAGHSLDLAPFQRNATGRINKVTLRDRNLDRARPGVA